MPYGKTMLSVSDLLRKYIGFVRPLTLVGEEKSLNSKGK